MSRRTGDQTLVREMNLSLVLHRLQAGAPLSRSGLAAETGLNKTTVSSLVDELIARGLAHEIGLEATNATGRPGMLVALREAAGVIVGVEVGVGCVTVLLTDLGAHIHWRETLAIPAPTPQEQVIAETVRLVATALAHAAEIGLRPLGIGLALPGLVDIARGLLVFSPNLRWRNVSLRAHFTAAFPSLPCYIENDANAAAMAERLFGAARGVDDFVYLLASAGLGGGVVLRGQLYRGAGGYAGELGHMALMVGDSRLCQCGRRGCWETLVNEIALMERVQRAILSGYPSLLTPLVHSGPSQLTPRAITAAALAGDEVALQALRETARYLGIGIANIADQLNPALVVIGGTLASGGEIVLAAAQQEVAARAMAEIGTMTRLALASHAGDSCALGAASIVIQEILNHPTAVALLDVAPPASVKGVMPT